ncbi:MAG: hypothetical protein ACRENS_10000 [Candidatus Eiseniibacteriota bacterium]
MTPTRRRLCRTIWLGVFSASVLSGCSAFQGSKRIDVAPFSENTVGMLSEMQKFNRPVAWVYLRKYTNLPTVTAARQGVQPIRDLLRGVGFYSTQVVSLYDSPLPEQRKISELARYLNDYIRPPLAAADTSETRFSTADLDDVLAKIRASKTFLDALSAAQPLINATVARGNALFEDMDNLVIAAAADINGRVEAEYAPLKASVLDLDAMHVASAHSYALLQRYRGGDSAALDSLRAEDPATGSHLAGGAHPTAKDLDEAERYLIERTGTIKSLREQLEPEFTNYRDSIAELDELRGQTDDRAKLGRMTLMLWARSHRNLAAGISVKPMIDVMGMVKSTVATGAKGILP